VPEHLAFNKRHRLQLYLISDMYFEDQYAQNTHALETLFLPPRRVRLITGMALLDDAK
jgi:hypothetical protein